MAGNRRRDRQESSRREASCVGRPACVGDCPGAGGDVAVELGFDQLGKKVSREHTWQDRGWRELLKEGL